MNLSANAIKRSTLSCGSFLRVLFHVLAILFYAVKNLLLYFCIRELPDYEPLKM